MNILLLEDNERLNQTITKRLITKGYKVDSFIDGEKAQDAFFKKKYSCYILDINVPSLSGIDILKQIRKKDIMVPVIIISSSVELETIRDSYHFGCDDYIKKPFFIDELEIKIDKLCQEIRGEVQFYKDSFYDSKLGIIIYSTHKEKLSKKEKLLFDLFLKESGKVVTYEAILDFVWKGQKSNMDATRSLVRRLRKKLPDDLIETIVDVGYLLKKCDT